MEPTIEYNGENIPLSVALEVRQWLREEIKKELDNLDYSVIEEIKQAYEQAVKDNKETFIIDGEEVLVRYAKEMLDYLESDRTKF